MLIVSAKTWLIGKERDIMNKLNSGHPWNDIVDEIVLDAALLGHIFDRSDIEEAISDMDLSDSGG